MNTSSYQQQNSQKSQDSIYVLNSNKIYEVWMPIEAPEAAKILMSLLATEQNMPNK
ncbi:hypothetical protein RIVM261_025650 [Rivularia sp. IAM M-261]|nr:hypothetical protein RIVM261_025650 [Rivularia sp. IAM M-261]